MGHRSIANTVIYLAVADRRVRNMGASVRSLRSAWCRFHSRRLGLAITRKLARMMRGRRDGGERAGQGLHLHSALTERRSHMNAMQHPISLRETPKLQCFFLVETRKPVYAPAAGI